MPQVQPPLYWDDDDNNINHLWVSHQVTPDDIEEMLFGSDGEPPQYIPLREGKGYVILGRTPDGRLLTLYGEFVTGANYEGYRFRPIGCRDMERKEKQKFKQRFGLR